MMWEQLGSKDCLSSTTPPGESGVERIKKKRKRRYAFPTLELLLHIKRLLK